MAKLKVKQIEDLGIISVEQTETMPVHNAIQIGSNSIIPLTGVNFTTDSANTGYIANAEIKGNIIELTRVAFDVSTGEGEEAYIGSLTFTENNSLAVNEVWLGDKINSLAGVNNAALKFKFVKFGTDENAVIEDVFTANAAADTTYTLEKVAKSGAAADVSIADTDNVITATTVEGALAEIAKEIDAMDLAATDVVALTVDGKSLQAGKISQTDGKVTVATAATLVEFNQALSDSNKVATMADVTAAQNNASVAGQEAIVVANVTGEGATGKVVSLHIDSNDKVLSQSTVNAENGTGGLKTTLTVDTKKYPTESAAEGYVAEKAGKTYIQIKGIGGEVISETDATAFVKDGMLQSAELVTAEGTEAGVTEAVPYFKFTWNTDAGSTITRISVKQFIDTYTAKENDWIVLTDHEFSHKTQENFSTEDATLTFGSKTNNGEFSFPKVTVDAAGHVTAMSEESISIATTVYVPKRKDFPLTGETPSNIVTLTDTPDTDSGVDVYLNGQLLAESYCTVNAEAKTVTIEPYGDGEAITLEDGDIIMVRYFVKETTAPITTQA